MIFRAKGFSLLELMIVLVMISILASMTYSTYRLYLLKGCRDEAKIALEIIATEQEVHFFKLNRYAQSMLELNMSEQSRGKHYNLEIPPVPGQDLEFQAIASRSSQSDCLPANDFIYRIDHVGRKQRKIPGEEWQDDWE